ncbi:MAG: cyclic nucleotide-binding domain-containing protein [Opitutaceae bacterium]|jgi:CRP-like cAMP-binding protein
MSSSSSEPQRKLRTQTFSSHTLISNEGDPSGGWYILISGRVGVFKGSHKVAEFDKRGSVFGEISSILSQPRTATLIAIEDSELVYVEANLDQLVRHHPEIAKKIISNLAERLVRTTDALWIAMDNVTTRTEGAGQDMQGAGEEPASKP